MADDIEMTPVTDMEPPKANPMAPSAGAATTLKLKPVIRKPLVTPATPAAAVSPVAASAAPSATPVASTAAPSVAPAATPATPATPTAAKPGLRPGLKLPGQGGLRPGLKLPPRPTIGGGGLKPGLKLPPKPVIRNSGSSSALVNPAPAASETSASAPAASAAPAEPSATPVAPTESKPVAQAATPATPATPTEAKPVASATPTPAKPGIRPGLKLPGQGGLRPGLKLPPKPVIRKPGSSPVSLVKPAPAASETSTPPSAVSAASAAEAKPIPSAMAVLKSVTQKLKGMTQPVPTPQQAVLHKTGIIAEPVAEATDVQKQAAKSKTSRISLSEAMGVAPVKEEQVQAKTIRIKRTTPGAAPATPATAPASAGAESGADKAKEQNPSLTQRKTLKISRPAPAGGSPAKPMATRPKFAIKKPGATKAPEPPPADMGDVADIPDLPTTASSAKPSLETPAPVSGVRDVPMVLAVFDLILQIAACGVIGFLGWMLYQDWLLPLFAGGCQ